jgi:hypothetical protein
MVTRTPRFLLAFSSLLSAVGGTIHAAAFRKAMAAIDASNLPHFYAASSKGLWLADSATLFILAAIFGMIAARPTTVARPAVVLVALIPAATAILLYTFLGNFLAGHLLLAIAALTFLAGLQFPGSAVPRTLQ